MYVTIICHYLILIANKNLVDLLSPREQTSVFDKYELKDLCPVCTRLPNPEQVKACQDYCSSKNYRPTRHLLLL
jgi:hypothetical protein